MARMLLGLAAAAASIGAFAPTAVAKRGDVIVRFGQTADASDRVAARHQAGTELDKVLRLNGVQLLDPNPGVSVSEAVKSLEASPDVVYAEPDRVRKAAVLPNDQSFSRLWGMDNTGQTVLGVSGTPDADIDAPEAWDVTTGSSAITVGVVDSGVDATHPDLAPNIVQGWDFVDGDSNPSDLNGHGTHVAGTIGARGNNTVGVAGVAWNAGIMPLRVLDQDGSGWSSDVADGYTYANQHGVQVVNASLGSTGYSAFERNALAAAANTLFVVAAGNGGIDQAGDDNDLIPEYPCAYDLPNVVCVAATDSNDALTSFSNYGTVSVDLAAPGTSIRSTWPGGIYPCSGSPCWEYLAGTSMATPHVAGTAALVLAAHPTDTIAELRQALLSSVEPKPSLAGKTVTGGRLNAFAALTGAAPTDSGTGGSAPLAQAPAPAPAQTTVVTVDTIAPTIRLAVRRQSLRSVLRHGLRVKVSSSEAARLRLDLVVAFRSAAGARVRAARSLLVGRVRDALSQPGSVTRPVALSARARRGLRGLHGVRLRLHVRAVDRKGNVRTVSRAVVLR